MKTTLVTLLLLFATVATGQETTTVFDLSTGRIISQQTRDEGYIFIQRGNIGVLQTFPPDYYIGSGGYRPSLYWPRHRGYYLGY
jgi:hypothetical protein